MVKVISTGGIPLDDFPDARGWMDGKEYPKEWDRKKAKARRKRMRRKLRKLLGEGPHK